MPASVAESTRTAIRPSLTTGVAVITNCVVPKKTAAFATRRTLLDMTVTTGSDTVTPETVCGKPLAAAFVSSESDTLIAKAFDVGRGVGVAGLAVAGVTADGVGAAVSRAVAAGAPVVLANVGPLRMGTASAITASATAKPTLAITEKGSSPPC